MNEYSVSDYGIFSEAVSSINALNNRLDSNTKTLTECKTNLCNGSIFMGPICDSCSDGFAQVDAKLSSVSSNFSAISSFLTETSASYKSGDEAANNKILSMENGNVVTTTSGNSGVTTGKANQDSIYKYLANSGFNDAAICGILANIQHESNFNPNALGDSGTSYGICQWHNTRWDRLKEYCSNNNLDSTTLDGQLSYLVWELQNNYPTVYEKMKSVPNTSQGAYDAAYIWTVDFERPANKETAGDRRGNTAISNYWSTYGSNLETL